MRQNVWGFQNKQKAELLNRFADSLNGGGVTQPGVRQVGSWPGGAAVGAWIAEADGSISAASGSTLGSGTAKILERSTATLSAYQPDGSTDVTGTVYNPLEFAIPDGMRFVLVRTLDGTAIVTHLFGYKPFIRFSLSAALATSDASKSATIAEQWGPGVANGAGSITVYNPAISTSSTYLFEGDSGDKGVATWRDGNNYTIYNMECP